MTSVEKRRSGRKSGGRRKHSDGGYSDTSSGGSFLDETDREVSNLTDRAFRSLCIGDEAVYNDSDLSSSSPCFQRDRQLAFGQSGLGRGREDREELKRAAHESFSLRVQQYGQDWLHEGMFGADVHRDPQWEVYRQNTQGRISATFQRSFMETSQQENSLREEHLSFLSNGATELNLQQRRSRSRVSSLIRAFNSEGQRDGSGMDGKLREWNDETSWDRSALMSIQRELSEFSYQQNVHNGHFPPAGPFSSNCYSSEVAAVTHMNSDSSFMRSSHGTRSLSAQVNCNSNFFIHSEYSPFKVWRDHNRFPFKQGEISGFMPRSEFPKWYETPMYKELSLETHSQGAYRFAERGINHPINNMAHVIHPNPPRSTSTSTVLQKTLAVEKRCESELASHYSHRKRAQSLGNNRLPSQSLATASPATEVSQRVRETICSAQALRQKIQMMTEQNMAAGFTANQQEVIFSNDSFVPLGNASVTVPPNVVTSKSGETPFSISQLLTPVVHAETSEVPQYVVSPQPVEHAPVRAESRGATPDVRMSSYKSRATSLLFNLKDNRKRVKSTYSPTKFKGLDAQEKSKHPSVQESRDTVIDIPDIPDLDIQFPNIEEASRTNVNYTAPSRATLNCPPATAYTGRNPEYNLNNYQAAQTQGEMVHHPGFTDFISKNDISNQLVNGQNLQEDSLSFAPYKQGMIDPGHALKPFCIATEMQKLNADNSRVRDCSISENTVQCFNEKVGREFTMVDGYQLPKDSKHNYSNVSSQDRWRPSNSLDTEKLSLKADISPWKQEITALIETDQYAQSSQRAAAIKEELNLSRDKRRGENLQSLNKELRKTEVGESFRAAASHQTNASANSSNADPLPQYASFNSNAAESKANYGQASSDKNILQTRYRKAEDKEMNENDLTSSFKRLTDQEYRNDLYSHRDASVLCQETAQSKQTKHLERPKVQESLQSREPKLQLQQHMQNNSWSHPDGASVPTLINQVKERQLVEVKAAAEHVKAQHAQAELAKAQPLAQVEHPKVESARLILAEHTSAEKGADADPAKNKRAEKAKAELIKEEKVEDKENVRERQTEPARVKRVTEKPRITTKEAGAIQIKEDKSEQMKAEQLVKRQTEQQIDQTIRHRITAKQADEEQVRAEQVERGQKEAEQIKTEKVKAAGNKAGQAKQEQKNEQQTKAEEKVISVKVGKVEEKNEKELTEASQVNAEQPLTQTSQLKVANGENKSVEQAKLERTKVEQVNAELTKAKNAHENWTKPAAKLTPQHVKIEPDKVEQVKTELAKAKAELAKIKEKMRVEQKEKARNTVSTKEDNVKNTDVSLGVNSNKTSDYSVKDKTTQGNQQRENKIVRGADDYERLREKYGFTNALTVNKSAVSNVGNDNTAKETPALSPDKAETMKPEKSKPERSPASAGPENTGMTESHYVYSESSKEFKLTSNVGNRANWDSAADRIKDYSVEKCESTKQTSVAQQMDPDLAEHPFERKPKAAEHTTSFTPPRTLSHKDKVQTKQEILTSRIKAHAEKEISALKEKGLAMRDGFMAKNPGKQVAAGQSVRPRPASHDVSKKHGSTVSSNITPKQQMELSEIQMAPAEAVSPLSPAVTLTSATSASHSQEQVPKEPEKAKAFVLEPHVEAKQTQSCAMSINEGLMDSQKKEKQEANPEENCGKPKERLKHSSVTNTSYLNKDKENPQKEQSKQEALFADPAPSLNPTFDHNEGPAADDDLQIMGIMVTVRERKPSLKATRVDDSTQEQTKAEEEEWDSHLPESPPSSDIYKEKSSSVEMAKTKDSVLQEAHPTAKKDQTNVAGNSQHGQETKEISVTQETPHHTKKDEIISNTEENNPHHRKPPDTRAHVAKAMSVVINDKKDSYRAGAETVAKQNVQLPVRENTATATKPFGIRDTDGTSGLLPEQTDSPATKQLNTSPSSSLTQNVSPKLQHTETNMEEEKEVDNDVHIDSIAIRVVPAVTEQHNLTNALNSEHKHVASGQEQVSSSNTENLSATSSEKHEQNSLEDKLEVQRVLSAVRKLSESRKVSNQHNSVHTISMKDLTEDEKPETVKESLDETKLKCMEGDYFQVQGLRETNNKKGDESDDALKMKEKESTSSEIHEGENHGLWRSNTVQSCSVSVKSDTIKRRNPETNDQMDLQQIDSPTEEQSNNEILEVGQANHVRKHRMDGQSILTTREKQRSRHSHSPREYEGKEKSEAKPKERISTIPEISAIADYARLKVIVSEDRADTVQDFSPNKKEGFFPLIQTRHSRRPVSIAESKDIFEKHNSFPNKMEVTAKVNKEAKALVFPITEKEHQRTGMFKLGDKERQDKPIDVRPSEKPLTDITKTLLAQTEHVDEPGTQRSSQRGQSIYHAINPMLLQNSSCAAKETRNIYEGLAYLHQDSVSGTTLRNSEEQTKRATEREVMATGVQDQQEKAERIREEEIKVKQMEEQRAALQRATQYEEARRRKEDGKSRTNIVEDTKTNLTGQKQQINENDKRKWLKQQHEERAAQEEQRRAAQEEQQRRAAQEEQQRRAVQEEQQRRAVQEEQRRAAQEEQQRRAVQEEQQRRAAQEEQRRAAQEEQQRRAVQEEQQRRAVQEEQRRAAQEEQQRRAVQEEQQRRAAKEEQQRRAEQEEQQRRAAQEEQQRRAVQEEQQRRAEQEEQQRRAAQEEQQRRAVQEEQRRAAQEEQQRRAVQEEQQRRAAQDEQQRRAVQEEQQRRAAQEEQQRRAAQEEQQRRAAQEEQQRRAAQEEQMRAAEEKLHHRVAHQELERKSAHEEQKWRAPLSEEQMQTIQIEEKTFANIEEQKKLKQKQVEAAQTEEARIKHIQKRAGWQTEDHRRVRQKSEESMRNQSEDEGKGEKEKAVIQLEEGKKITQDQLEEKIKLEVHRRTDTGPEMEEEKKASQGMDALQYYAITCTEAEKKLGERQQSNNPSAQELIEDSGSHIRLHRPQAPASPASSLPRSNTSSPALGAKPLMFRVKDNTSRGSSLTKSVKPRLHRSFGEEFRVGSPMERGEEELEMSRRSAATPANLDTGLNRLGPIKEASASSSQDYSAPLPQHRPYSRRSLAVDEEDSRSVISNMSDGTESFASCATDVANVRGLYDYERPESACSFSSDVCRALGRPPAVPPKSEKALQRAKRLTSRRIKKELSKAAADPTGGVEKPPLEVSPSTDDSKRHVVASPHFSPPVSLAHAPTLGSSVPSSHSGPHATGPISLPAALPHATVPSSLTGVSPHATSCVTPQTVAHVASSPTVHHANQPAPVAKYHVEPSYPQSYPLTQRKVLQDLGSGQYYVVDVPVQVKTKTFFDPETGHYVQLNVRESGQSTSRSRPQKTHPQSHLHPQVKVNPQQPTSQATPAGEPFLLYQGCHGYPQNYQPVGSVPPHGSSVNVHQDQQPVRENHSHAPPAPEVVRDSEGHRYSPEKTPYMDTVSDTGKTHPRVYNTPGSYESFPECDTNSRLARSSVCVNDNSAHTQYQPCDIIPMSELEDFMDVSDW